MVTTSTKTAAPGSSVPGTGEKLDCCENCGASVGLTDSTMLLKGRIVGCVECDWGRTPQGLVLHRA